ncbi:MAG TPA: PP2C family serine/threonine-protein phosphatase [Steroidobacteraceae bacterium]|nr:PP2C family serine/threonine-protein phosphatase [Steroidobacteraceae bacterium]
MQVEFADLSLLGSREDNQDRVAVAVGEQAALLVVVDGMGGHAEGARAAETARQVLLETFWQLQQPLFDPLGFLHLTLGRAHEEIVKIGLQLPLEQRPRATCAVCIVQQDSAWWAHVGDSRVYKLRRGAVAARTRDHSHVELLLREGLITSEQVANHPMRNFVECCLGGDPILPDMSVSQRQLLEPGDVLLLCTDGLWSGTRDEELASVLAAAETPLRELLSALCQCSVANLGAASDNTSAAALRWRGA